MNHQELPGQIGFDGITQEDRVYQNAVERVRLAYGRLNGKKLTTWQTGQDVFDWWMDDKNMDFPVPGQIFFEV